MRHDLQCITTLELILVTQDIDQNCGKDKSIRYSCARYGGKHTGRPNWKPRTIYGLKAFLASTLYIGIKKTQHEKDIGKERVLFSIVPPFQI